MTSARRIDAGDAHDLAAFGLSNCDFHGENFVCPTDPSSWAALAADAAQRWFRIDDGPALVGVICLTRVSPAPWCSAELGAGAARDFAGEGRLAAGLRLVLGSEMRAEELERVEALVDPNNEASRHFVTAAGFRLEGIARSAIAFSGGRRDMERWAVVLEDLISG